MRISRGMLFHRDVLHVTIPCGDMRIGNPHAAVRLLHSGFAPWHSQQSTHDGGSTCGCFCRTLSNSFLCDYGMFLAFTGAEPILIQCGAENGAIPIRPPHVAGILMLRKLIPHFMYFRHRGARRQQQKHTPYCVPHAFTVFPASSHILKLSPEALHNWDACSGVSGTGLLW